MLRDIFTEEKLQQQAMLLQRRFSPGFDGMDAKAAVIWVGINGKKLINESPLAHNFTQNSSGCWENTVQCLFTWLNSDVEQFFSTQY